MSIQLTWNGRLVVRWILGTILVWAAVSKLANLQEFYGSLVAYRMPIGTGLLRAIAMFLPWLELLCGLALLGNIWTEAALGWAVTLFAIFTLATGQAWMRGLEISCGCLQLSVIGLGGLTETGFGKFLESVAFAFFRALVLGLGGLYLLRAPRGAATI
jgi:putative oxidoreductase